MTITISSTTYYLEKTQIVVYVLFISVLFLSTAYIVFTRNSVLYAVTAHTMGKEERSLQGALYETEIEYLSRKEKISKDTAYLLGFKETHTVFFAKRMIRDGSTSLARQ